VTDERSAGFYALGMTQALHQPVVVCVTSGTALLNLLPAVAEAYYQHRPLIVISADRPPQWIDQLDGQTLPQPDALGRFVKKAVTLPEPRDEEEHWYCNRLVNEALIVRNAPVHINVPLTEPLFDFTVAELPIERKIDSLPAEMSPATLSHVTRMFMQSKRPLLISGQPMNPNLDEVVYWLEGHGKHEADGGDASDYLPDFVLYIGDSIVSKRAKHYLRKAKETWVVNETGEVTDTFKNLTHVVQGDGEAVADHIRFMMVLEPHPFVKQWDDLLAKARQYADAYEPAYSQMAAVKYFETYVGDAVVHYANSSAIRLANIFAHHPVWCNRGVNGIEGSLSTAAGFSVVSDESVFCVIGDLSFFYDQNALWNQNLKNNFHILLLNNGKGGIFNMLPGLENSPVRDEYVSAAHHTTAEGICQQNGIAYLSAFDMHELRQGIDELLHTDNDRPMLLEVFTTAADDEQVLKDYYKTLQL